MCRKMHIVHCFCCVGWCTGDRRRSHLSGAKDRIFRLYYQLTEIVELLAELVRRQKLTDEVLLQVKRLSVNMQLCSMQLCEC